MAFNAFVNHISAILWRSVLLVEETREPGENYRTTASYWKLYHMLCIEYTSPRARFKLTIFVVINTDYTGSVYPTSIRPRPRRVLSVQKTSAVFHPIRDVTRILFKKY